MTCPVPCVAAILTCYNEGPYIGGAVRSILRQTRADLLESIVIADDGSGAETCAVLKDIESWDPRIRVLYGPGGGGLAAQRNWAIRCSSAPLLAILDGDDLWSERKLELQVGVLEHDLTVGLVYSGYYAFAGEDLTTAAQAAVRDISAHPNLTRAYFLNDPPIIPSTTLIRRTAFDACGGFNPQIHVFEDTDFYLRLSRVTRFGFVESPLLYKRSNAASITGSRRDLMAHHAFVAFNAAKEDPNLLPLVPRRLAERARKLGNHRFLFGELDEARRLQRLAVRLNPLNWRAWLALIASARCAAPLWRLVSAKTRARRAAHGVVEPCQ
jgi:glycosyltransferase involved in cell wall biosynthesis